MEKKSKPEGQPTSPRKTYRSPELSFYGDVSQMTRGTGGTMGDVAGAMTMSCWIAEALYGVDAPRTRLVRAWLTECYDRQESWALLVVPLYRRFGKRVAARVRSQSLLQRLFLPLFDRAVWCAHQEYAPKVVIANKAA